MLYLYDCHIHLIHVSLAKCWCSTVFDFYFPLTYGTNIDVKQAQASVGRTLHLACTRQCGNASCLVFLRFKIDFSLSLFWYTWSGLFGDLATGPSPPTVIAHFPRSLGTKQREGVEQPRKGIERKEELPSQREDKTSKKWEGKGAWEKKKEEGLLRERWCFARSAK